MAVPRVRERVSAICIGLSQLAGELNFGELLDAFEDYGDALAYAYTHGAEGVFPFGAVQFVHGGGNQTRAAGSERVSDGDGAAVGIYVRSVVGDAEFSKDRKRLCRKGFIKFNNIHLFHGQVGVSENFARGGDRTHAHDAGCDSGGGGGDYASLWSETVFVNGGFGSKEECACTIVDAGRVAGGNGALGFDHAF